MKDRSSITVEGEPLEALIGVLMRFEHDEPACDGMIHVHAEYPCDIGDPFARALGSADYVERCYPGPIEVKVRFCVEEPLASRR